MSVYLNKGLVTPNLRQWRTPKGTAQYICCTCSSFVITLSTSLQLNIEALRQKPLTVRPDLRNASNLGTFRQVRTWEARTAAGNSWSKNTARHLQPSSDAETQIRLLTRNHVYACWWLVWHKHAIVSEGRGHNRYCYKFAFDLSDSYVLCYTVIHFARAINERP